MADSDYLVYVLFWNVCHWGWITDKISLFEIYHRCYSDGSVVRSTCFPFRVSVGSSPNGGSQVSETLLPGIHHSLLASIGSRHALAWTNTHTDTHICNTYIHAGKPCTHQNGKSFQQHTRKYQLLAYSWKNTSIRDQTSKVLSLNTCILATQLTFG